MATGFQYNDGGRSRYFKARHVSDCVVRSIAIAREWDYMVVYGEVKKFLGYSPRNGIKSKDTKKVMAHFGGEWQPTMVVGCGCTTHLENGEIPMTGRIVCKCSKHVVAVIDGVIHDTYDSSRDGNRCVYGYWTF